MMDSKEWGQILNQNLGSPLALLSQEIQMFDSLPAARSPSEAPQLFNSMQLINRSLSKSLEILPTRSPNSCIKRKPVREMKHIFTSIKHNADEIVEVRTKEESAADSILRSQEKLREHTASASRSLQPSHPDDCSSFTKSSQNLLAYIEQRGSSSFPLPSFSPPHLKYLESIHSGAAISDEVLEATSQTSSVTKSHPIDSLRRDPSAIVAPASNIQVMPTLSLEEILKENDIPEEAFAMEPPSSAVARETKQAVSSWVPTRASSSPKETNPAELLPEDDFLESLLSETKVSSQYLPVAKTVQLDSQYQWASTTPLSEAEYEALRPHLAMKYPFELDYFQRQAVMRLERRESVFVAAHTSAGKTVVAEYAIALAKKHHTRTIYTSPIKALSNQKYRDFRDRFDDVGLITGDVSINPDAACLIMTTEILRSMLYRGSDTIRDIEFVIFDEVHYVNDSERGVVWEEVIIMLPDKINMIFLSATTPNTLEFSDWIGRTKQRKVYVVSTSKRPVPLQHFLYHDDNMFCLMKNEAQFRQEAMAQAVQKEKDKLKPKVKSAENAAMASQRQAEKAAIAAQASGGRAPKASGRGAGRGAPGRGPATQQQKVAIGDLAGGKGQWLSILRILRQGGREAAGGQDQIDFGVGYAAGLRSKAAKEEISHMKRYDQLPEAIRSQISRREYEQLDVRGEDEGDEGEEEGGLLPVVVFCFSKKKCEEIVDFFKGQDLSSAREKSEVRKVMSKVLSRLNPSDARLPQVLRIEEMLLRGFGVHHGGLLPVLKESVELLYSKSVVKVLLATETFAMGVNMPARSVVFNGYRKHDGKGFRDLLPGEYTQMAGRAGRRGKDKVGTVIVAAWTELPTEVSLKKLLTGTPMLLSSQFRLTYNMMLNLLRVNDLGVEDMMKKSFSEFRMQRAISSSDASVRLQQYERLLQQLESVPANHNDLLSDISLFFSAVVSCQQLLLRLMDYLVTQKGLTELASLLSPGRFVLVHSPLEKSQLPSLLHLGVLIGEDSSTALVGSAEKQSSASLLQNLRQDMAPKIGDSARQDSLLSKFVWVRLVSPVSGGLHYEAHLEKVPLTALVALFTSRVKTQHTAKEFLGPSSASVPGALVPLRRDDDFTFGPRSGAKKSLKEAVPAHSSPGAELESIDRDLLAFVSGTASQAAAMAPFLDLPTETKLRDLSFCELFSEFLATSTSLSSCQTWTTFLRCFPLDSSAPAPALTTLLQEDLATEWKLHKLRGKIHALKYYTSTSSLALFPDFQQRMKVLDHLGYIENSPQGRTVTLKGRVACEMNTSDELIATEILFFNVLEPLNPPEVVALLSALVFQEKNNESCPLTSRLEIARNQVLGLSKSLQALQDNFGVTNNDNDSRGGLNFGLAAPVYEWARGIPFKEIADMTMTPEGSIVRTITRLDELCKDFRNAARVVGNPSLYRKMEAASQCIKRDIVFAASLYVS